MCQAGIGATTACILSVCLLHARLWSWHVQVALCCSVPAHWPLLKIRLEKICPRSQGAQALWRWNNRGQETLQHPFLLQVTSYNREGVLHGESCNCLVLPPLSALPPPHPPSLLWSPHPPSLLCPTPTPPPPPHTHTPPPSPMRIPFWVLLHFLVTPFPVAFGNWYLLASCFCCTLTASTAGTAQYQCLHPQRAVAGHACLIRHPPKLQSKTICRGAMF